MLIIVLLIMTIRILFLKVVFVFLVDDGVFLKP